MKKIIIAAVALVTTSCASVVSGTQQSLLVETPKLEGAECKLTDSKGGKWYVPKTPDTVTVTKGDGPMTIVCNKKGYETTTHQLEEDIAGATLGNILLGGGVGIFVDAATGAAQKYPDKAVVWMKPNKFASKKAEEEWNEAKKKYEEEEKAKQQAKQEQYKRGRKNYSGGAK